jgi:hypothetical protein
MRLRVAVAVIGLVLVVASAKPLWAAPRRSQEAAMCCGSQSDCGSERCCDPQSLGLEDCDPNAPGWCRATCTSIRMP